MNSSPGSKSLVIDANIARAAGENIAGPSRPCSDFLEAVREHKHKVVFTPDVLSEWDEHGSRFTSGWRGRMLRTNQIIFLPDAKDHTLRNSVSNQANDDGSRTAMLKDVHLLEAALAADRRVASMDDRARSHFLAVSPQIDIIRGIMWVNPDTDSVYCLDWLQRGAPIERERQLGYQHRNQ
ncbi:MAG: hypothetical protein J4G17_02725 [Anaerolineae bacterium]|nr:hypothetical protein [Anaerolineae bacterium]